MIVQLLHFLGFFDHLLESLLLLLQLDHILLTLLGLFEEPFAFFNSIRIVIELIQETTNADQQANDDGDYDDDHIGG